MRIGLAGVGRIGAFHAETLKGLDFVEELVLTDANTEAAREVADRLGTEYAPSAEALLASGVDGFVIAAATPAHAPLLRQGVEAGVPGWGVFWRRRLFFAGAGGWCGVGGGDAWYVG